MARKMNHRSRAEKTKGFGMHPCIKKIKTIRKQKRLVGEKNVRQKIAMCHSLSCLPTQLTVALIKEMASPV
jgi:hypothetical protein